MTSHLIWALVASLWALVLWDMVRRWAFATATRTLKADLDEQRRLLAAMGSEMAEAKLPARVKQLETVVISLKAHAESTRLARANPFAKRVG